MAAADEVRIEYEPLPAVTSVDQAMEEGATVVHEGAPDNVHVWFHRVSGDPDAAFEEADFTIDLELSTQRYAAVCMEARAVAATYD